MESLRSAFSLAIEQRRSIRVYEERPIPEEHLRELLRLAGRAPSAWNVQPWRFAVARDAALKQELMKASFGQKQVGQAAAVVCVYSDMPDALANFSESLHPSFSESGRSKTAATVAGYFEKLGPEASARWGLGQTYIALGYLIAAAAAAGIATSPMLGFDPAAARQVLSLPPHAEIAALVALGYAAEAGLPPHRRDPERLILWR